jgi:hypothetical protein
MLLLLFVYVVSCSEKQKEYYPVLLSIEEDLQKLDSLPLAITRIRTQSNQKDTTLVEVEELRKLSSDLLQLDWDKSNQNKYDEFILNDPSSSNTSFTYSAKESAQVPIKKIQINFKPETTTPKSLYAERIDISGEISIMRKILWTKGSSFSITSSYYRKGVLIETSVDQFNWGIL